MLKHKKFETAYCMAKDELSLKTFDRILALEEFHNVELSSAYNNNNMCGEFIDYIANDLALKILQKLKSSNFQCFLGWDNRCTSVRERDNVCAVSR